MKATLHTKKGEQHGGKFCMSIKWTQRTSHGSNYCNAPRSRATSIRFHGLCQSTRIAKFYPRRSHGIERVYCTVLYRRCVLQTLRVERPGAMPHFQLEVVPALRFLSVISTFSSNLPSTRHPFRLTSDCGAFPDDKARQQKQTANG